MRGHMFFKYIVSVNGRYVGYIYTDNYDCSLAAFREMFLEVKKDFPHITEDKVVCHTVVRSTMILGHGVLQFSPLVETKEGWGTSVQRSFRLHDADFA